MAAIDYALLDLNQPKVFESGGQNNVLVLCRQAFGQVFALLAEHGVVEPEQLSVFQSHVDFVTAKMKLVPHG